MTPPRPVLGAVVASALGARVGAGEGVSDD